MAFLQQTVIGVDLGGTKIHTARIHAGKIEKSFRMNISAQAEKDVILQEIIQAIQNVLNDESTAIGIGVPGLVDLKRGIVYDMTNIPSWDEVNLKQVLQEKFNLPVYINNDANCFTLGEMIFGKGQGFKDIIGLTLGTGMGAGIIIDGKLYCGANCGAGEFGMLPYLEHNYEYYCSGQFFKNIYGVDGFSLFERAQKNDRQALKIFSEFGWHLGKAIIAIFYALDPQIIVLGGSVSKSYPFFARSMNETLSKVAFQKALTKMQIAVSDKADIPVLGAAALTFQIQDEEVEESVPY